MIVAFALPLRKVEGNAMEKIKKIDGWGSLVSFAASIAILLPISWCVGWRFCSRLFGPASKLTGGCFLGLERDIPGHRRRFWLHY